MAQIVSRAHLAVLRAEHTAGTERRWARQVDAPLEDAAYWNLCP